ncbi:MAG: polysaccharide biosynthesis/export family protein, partial [Muribaculum sp.]|nr:polysaccharide biosynthesis/export family protein [Muribaculum sp.]
YNLPMYNPATNAKNLSATQGKQQTFIVNREGNINIPSIGDVHVAGLTVDEAAQLIGNKISKDVKDPYVKVVLQNFSVNVLGEVNQPTRLTVTTDRYSVIDAITACGDLTAFGRRDNVLLIRDVDGVKHFYRINLNDSKLFDSPYFYLQQNDIVYVEPTKVKESSATYDPNRSFKLSVATAIISGVSVVASMLIALLIK